MADRPGFGVDDSLTGAHQAPGQICARATRWSATPTEDMKGRSPMPRTRLTGEDLDHTRSARQMVRRRRLPRPGPAESSREPGWGARARRHLRSTCPGRGRPAREHPPHERVEEEGEVVEAGHPMPALYGWSAISSAALSSSRASRHRPARLGVLTRLPRRIGLTSAARRPNLTEASREPTSRSWATVATQASGHREARGHLVEGGLCRWCCSPPGTDVPG
jgi:hypothetical protein